MIHKCKERKKLHADPDRIQSWGFAITKIEKDSNGRWYAHNDEYARNIAFCPFCGVRLDTLGKKKRKQYRNKKKGK